MHTVRVKFAVLFLLAAGGVFAPAFLEAFYRQNAPLPARPFSAAERLVYAIKWDPPWYLFFLPSMGAGDVEIRLDGITEYRNKNAFKIVLHAKSSGALARLTGVQVDNTFTYYTDPATFCTIGAINIVREGNRRRHNETHYFYETGNLSFREINEAVDPPEIMKDILVENIPACVHDPLSALYFYRTMQLHPRHTSRLMVGNNDKVNEVSLQVEKEEFITTPLGRLSAWKVGVASLLGELFRESGRLNIWFSNDDKRLPIQFEVRVRLGKVVGELKEYHP